MEKTGKEVNINSDCSRPVTFEICTGSIKFEVVLGTGIHCENLTEELMNTIQLSQFVVSCKQKMNNQRNDNQRI